MTHSSYYIAPVGDRTHDLPHTVASNMVNVSQSPNHSATAAVLCANYIDRAGHIQYYRCHGLRLLSNICDKADSCAF